MIYLIVAVLLGPVVAYWIATVAAARRLRREQRRRLGQPNTLPDLFDPGQSHKWFWIILSQKTADLEPSKRRAFHAARLALVLIPLGCLASLAIAANTTFSVPERRDADAPPSVTLRVRPDR